jgi:hypothetical protein
MMLDLGFLLRRSIVPPAALIVTAISAGSALAASESLKKAPQEGEIRYGKVVYVDDGTCPEGEIKEITGGSREKNILRQVRCVKRPSRLQ